VIEDLSTGSSVRLDKGFIACPDSVDEQLQKSRGFVRGICSSFFHIVLACGFVVMLLYFSETAQPLTANREGGNPEIVYSYFSTHQLMRIDMEENIITGYTEYQTQTRWRLVPGIW